MRIFYEVSTIPFNKTKAISLHPFIHYPTLWESFIEDAIKFIRNQHEFNTYSNLKAEVGTRYFFPGSQIAKSLFCTHGSLSLNRYFGGF
jgi:hypothetical protein